MNARREVADRMTSAADAFLETLDQDQRARATWPFPSDSERRSWFYTPTDHGGLSLAEMSPVQQRMTHQLLGTGLSRAGYVTVAAIMGLENVLDHTEGWQASFGRERGRDPQLYWVAIFGAPGDAAWSWRFGGHHVSVHYTIEHGEVVSSTPNFLGADPASSPLLGPHLHRPLAAAEDLARELVHALQPAQLSKALLSPRAPTDIVGANRSQLVAGEPMRALPEVFRGRLPDPYHQLMVDAQAAADRVAGLTDDDRAQLTFGTEPAGCSVGDFADDQVELLRALLETYLGRLPDGLADTEFEKLADERIRSLSFAWAGGVEPGQPHYYRIHGSDLLVEYDNTQRDVNHIHTVWRDLHGDFGGDPLADHYRAARDSSHRHDHG